MTVKQLMDFLATLPPDMRVIESAYSDTVDLTFENGVEVVDVIDHGDYLRELIGPFSHYTLEQRRELRLSADKVLTCLKIGSTA